MVTMAHFRLPLSGFPLGTLIEVAPERRIELERIVPAEEGVMPFFWVWNCPDPEEFVESALAIDAVREIEPVAHVDGDSLYRAQWNADVEGFVRTIGETGATILEGRGSLDGWTIALRFGDRDDIRQFQSLCLEADVPVELRRIGAFRETNDGGRYGLTEDQRQTITVAYGAGYFDEPRAITQAELAERFGVSQRAISRRLRRGLSTLVGSTVGTLDDGDAFDDGDDW